MTWMTAVRDHPARPSQLQRHVLLCLALRVDWRTGAGFASAAQLAADADASDDTAQRATRWAREHELLHRTRRGHRTGDGHVVASEWELTLPSQTRTGAGLSESQTRSGTVSNPQGGRLKPAPSAAPSRTSSSRTSSSAARERASAGGARAGARPETLPRQPPCPYCGREVDWPSDIESPEEVGRDEHLRLLRMALAGQLACSRDECRTASYSCIRCGTQLADSEHHMCRACRVQEATP